MIDDGAECAAADADPQGEKNGESAARLVIAVDILSVKCDRGRGAGLDGSSNRDGRLDDAKEPRRDRDRRSC